MARYTVTRWRRLAFAAAILLAVAVPLVVRPGIALAHHVTAMETGDCTAWDTKAEYFGGDGDRKIVIDVMINAEHVSATLYFDLGVGHLGHTDYYLLYDRSGNGSLHTSGTITMYEKIGATYSHVVNNATLGMNFDCAPSPTATSTATATTVPPTNTVTSTATAMEQSTSTPRPARTPSPTATSVITESTVTPFASATPTPLTTLEIATPASTNTARTTGGLATPGARTTPTLVSIVHSSARPSESLEPAPPVDRALPSTGQGAPTRGAILAGLLGTLVAAVGLVMCARGLGFR